MKRVYLLILTLFSCMFIFTSVAQETQVDTLKLKLKFPDRPPLSMDSKLFQQSSESILLEIPEGLIPTLMTRDWRHLSYIRKPSETKPPIFPFEFTPNLNFTINSSRWELPVLGATTTFAPTLTFRPLDRMFLYGGVGFTQFHNLAYVQNMVAPNWPTRSNITSQAFGGVGYVLHDRVTLHGMYQHSLHNQLPNNMMLFSPAYNMMSVGADIDVWNGLGVRVEHIWEFDKFGRMQKGMRYSPIIDVNKFMKFLGH